METQLRRLSWFGLFLILIPLHVYPQSTKKKWPNDQHDCSGNCFSAEVVSVTPGDDGCTHYEMRVSHNGACRYGLSHLVVEMPCGYVSKIEAPGGCGNDFGKDPTTGIKGLKIDGPQDFGKGPQTSFTFKFTWCNNAACNTSDCWEPRVAFKAATCVDYDTASNSCQAPPSLKATVQKQNISCSGSADGKLSVSAEGGQTPYTYSWSTGCDVQTIEQLPPGTYTVTVTDAAGNVVTLTETVQTTSNIELAGVIKNPTCTGSANGAIDLSVTGGVEPYTYVWSNGATTQDLTNLTGGSYKVTVTDSTGCVKDTIFTLVNSAVVIAGQMTKPGCGLSNGQINITVSGGASPYSFAWSNGATTEDLSGLAAGTYGVTVTDANACSSKTSFFLTANNTLKITFQVTPTSCVENSSGAIDLTVTGGTQPYTYAWQNGSTSEDLSGLSAGLQRVTVTDAGGCTANSIINVFKQTFQVPSQVVSPSCTGQSDGAITLSPAGIPPFTYLWSTGATTNAIENLTAGQYSVTVTDNTGCSQLLNFFISDPLINPTATVNNPNCGAEGDFSINLTVSGGVAPYSYLWTTGETTEDISGLNSGTYSVHITDTNGCGKVLEVVVEPVVIDWSCSITPPAINPLCGSSGNILSSTVTGASSYSWNVESNGGQWVISSGQNTPAITYTAGGNGSSATFTLSILKNGCTQTCSCTISACSPVMTCGAGSPSIVVNPLTAETHPGDTASIASSIVAAPQGTGTQAGELPASQPVDEESSGEEDEGSSGKEDKAPNENTKPEFQLSAYPNPVVDKVYFVWTAEANEYVKIDLIDIFGRPVAELFSDNVRAGEVYRADCSAGHLNDQMYFYRYKSGTRTTHGRLFKGH